MAERMLLTIAGFDPSSGAGITADLAVFASHGFFGLSAITALTVQSTMGVAATHAVESPVLAETLRVLCEDLPPSGIKLGMLATAANVLAVAEFLRGQRRRVPVVLDPVLRSSSGRKLLDAAGLEAMREELLPLVDWVTPNTAELGALTGVPVMTKAEVEQAAAQLCRQRPGLNMVATGGDALGAQDLLTTAAGTRWCSGEWVESTSTHGTGCAFSSALLCGLVLGQGAEIAVLDAKAFVTEAIRCAPGLGRGRGPMKLR